MKQLVLKTPYWLLPLGIWTALVLASLIWNWQALDRHSLELAGNRARFVFEVVHSIRLWNARHGGVYAPVSEHTQPNPYLKVPERDLTSTTGVPLTLINPAYMTRQLSEVVSEQSEVQVRLTSLKPLNPDNAADNWEAEALQAFETGVHERVELIDSADTQPIIRFMAPLYVREPCMRCHEHQGYQPGDVRGGLSVSFSAEALLDELMHSRENLAFVHAGVWGLVSGLLLFSLFSFRRHLLSLRAAKEQLGIQVREQTEELHTLIKAVEFSPTSTLITDARGVIEYVNPKFTEVTGYLQNEVLGRTPNFQRSGQTPERVYQELWETICAGQIWKGTLLNRKKDGELYWESLSIAPIRDTHGAISHFVALQEDITEAKRQQDLIHYQANYDNLTGLANRKRFYECLHRLFDKAQRNGGSLTLMFIDLDGFKAVNDRLGHEAGDQLLQQVAGRIQDSVRKGDILCRLGGDEFTLLLPELDDDEVAGRIAAQIIGHLNRPFSLDGDQGQISASIGIARYPRDSSSAEMLLQHADQAMYDVKASGRRNYRFYGKSR